MLPSWSPISQIIENSMILTTELQASVETTKQTKFLLRSR